MNRDAGYWIERLQLKRHPEGGAFAETYRSPLMILKEHLPPGFYGSRPVSTSIYFLLEQTQFSAFHRIASDEGWHFYTGDPLLIYEIEAATGNLIMHRLGEDRFQATIKAGNWFAACMAKEGAYALAGCTVAPGFDFEDFILGERQALIHQYPQHAGIISLLTRV